MMWKDSYRLGVERIDNQHIELFRMTEDLVRAVSENATMEAYQKALGFLKEYVIYHFRDEEEYQASIHYSGAKAHKEEHRRFTQTVLNYEKALEKNGFDLETMKDLVGTVTAWLIYHVVDTDQKIVSGEDLSKAEASGDHLSELFAGCALDVMSSMAGMDLSGVQRYGEQEFTAQGDIYIELELVGDTQGVVALGFPKELALYLIHSMTMMELQELDELVQSALCELTNISCGNAATALANRGLACDIKPPVVSRRIAAGDKVTGTYADTQAGRLETVLFVKDPA
ncbi:MAG: bacteriohemerythrin [Acutalibacter sp.]